jgi:lipopolysaccharide export system permease protein
VVVGAIFMFVVIDFVGNIKTWLARDVHAAYDYYISYLPYILYLITPVALFIAVLASVGNMTRHLEMSAMQSSGQNPFRTLMPIFVFGILVSLGAYEMSELWLPDANHKRLEIMETNAQKKKNPRIKEKNNFTFIDSERASWFFRHYSGDKKLGRDVVLLLRDQGHLVERFDAKTVTWAEEEGIGYWLFERGHQRIFNKDGSVTVLPFTKEKLVDKVSTRPEDLINERQVPDEMDSKMVRLRCLLSISRSRLMSILSTSALMSFSMLREECPLPKSSISTMKPSLCRRSTIWLCFSTSSISAVSVISTRRRLGLRSYFWHSSVSTLGTST